TLARCCRGWELLAPRFCGLWRAWEAGNSRGGSILLQLWDSWPEPSACSFCYLKPGHTEIVLTTMTTVTAQRSKGLKPDYSDRPGSITRQSRYQPVECESYLITTYAIEEPHARDHRPVAG